MNSEHITYDDTFGVYIPKEIRKYIGNKNITTNNYRRRANNLNKFGEDTFVLD